MIKLFHKLIMAASPVLLCGALLTGCTDDKYNKIDDLFQPRFVLDEPEVTRNLYRRVLPGPVSQQSVHGARDYGASVVCR